MNSSREGSGQVRENKFEKIIKRETGKQRTMRRDPKNNIKEKFKNYFYIFIALIHVRGSCHRQSPTNTCAQ